MRWNSHSCLTVWWPRSMQALRCRPPGWMGIRFRGKAFASARQSGTVGRVVRRARCGTFSQIAPVAGTAAKHSVTRRPGALPSSDNRAECGPAIAATGLGPRPGARHRLAGVEAPSPDHPLLAFDQGPLSTHIDGPAGESAERPALHSVQNVLDFLAGRLDPAPVVNAAPRSVARRKPAMSVRLGPNRTCAPQMPIRDFIALAGATGVHAVAIRNDIEGREFADGTPAARLRARLDNARRQANSGKHKWTILVKLYQMN